MKAKVYRKSELNGKCPFCPSKKIFKGVMSYGAKVGGNSNKYPEANIEIWHCDECKKQFEVFKEL